MPTKRDVEADVEALIDRYRNSGVPDEVVAAVLIQAANQLNATRDRSHERGESDTTN